MARSRSPPLVAASGEAPPLPCALQFTALAALLAGPCEGVGHLRVGVMQRYALPRVPPSFIALYMIALAVRGNDFMGGFMHRYCMWKQTG